MKATAYIEVLLKRKVSTENTIRNVTLINLGIFTLLAVFLLGMHRVIYTSSRLRRKEYWLPMTITFLGSGLVVTRFFLSDSRYERNMTNMSWLDRLYKQEAKKVTSDALNIGHQFSFFNDEETETINPKKLTR